MNGHGAIITGGAAGIGLALARRLCDAGVRVALLDRDAGAAERAAATLRDAGHEASAFGCDVTDEAACNESVRAALAVLGRIDLLVANAGITHVGRVLDTEVDVLRRVLDVNLFGAVHVAKAALPELLETRGQIVVMGSVAGQAPLATRAGYSASKHALHGFFRSLRAEHLEDGLGVLIVDPSFVDTGIGDRALGPDGGLAGADSRTGVGGSPASPEAVAEAIHRALVRRRRHLFVPWTAGLFTWISRLAPGFYERGMARRMRR